MGVKDKVQAIYMRVSLFKRIYFFKCFKKDSPKKIIKYFKYLTLKDDEIKRIADDLFTLTHANGDYNIFYWNEGWALNQQIEKIIDSKLIFPQYFIDVLVDTFMTNYGEYDPYSYQMELYDKIASQPNFSSQTLLRQILWVGEENQNTLLYKRLGKNNDLGKRIDLLFSHLNITPELLMTLAYNRDPEIRGRAVKHPLCPATALVVNALVAGGEKLGSIG